MMGPRVKEVITKLTENEIEPAGRREYDDYEWMTYSEDQTGFPLYRVVDKKTGFALSTFTPGGRISRAMFESWCAAMHSRNPGSHVDIAHTIVDKNIDAGKKMGDTAEKYGHDSIRDMAWVGVNLENIPIHLAQKLFHMCQFHSGQEKSTRFQKQFSAKAMASIEGCFPPNLPDEIKAEIIAEYNEVGGHAIQMYTNLHAPIQEIFTGIFEPKDDDERKSVRLRMLDCASFMLPQGIQTGMTLFSTARTWQAVIATLKGSENPQDVTLGDQLQQLLAPSENVQADLGYVPEIGDLIKHTKPDRQLQDNLQKIKTYLRENEIEPKVQPALYDRVNAMVTVIEPEIRETTKMIAQYVSILYPGMAMQDAIAFAAGLANFQEDAIMLLISTEHTRFKQLPEVAGVGGVSVIFECSDAVRRDLNRHRKFPRFFPGMPNYYHIALDYDKIQTILHQGFILPAHVTDIEEMETSGLRSTYEMQLKSHYEEVRAFTNKLYLKYGDSIDYSFIIGLLPLAHRTELVMHGNFKNWHYMIDTRTALGGRYDYRKALGYAGRKITRAFKLPKDFFVIYEATPKGRTEFYGRS